MALQEISIEKRRSQAQRPVVQQRIGPSTGETEKRPYVSLYLNELLS